MNQPRRASIVHRSDRCDECRRRKRGCDKKKPACSGCLDRKITCQYSRLALPFINLHVPVTTSSAIERGANSATKGDNAHAVGAQLTKPNRASSRLLPDRQRSRTRRATGETRSNQASWDLGGPWYQHAFPKIRPPILHNEAKLARELYEILYCASSPGSHMHLWGDWLVYIPQRVGTTADTLLIRAVVCLILGHRAAHTPNSGAAKILGEKHYGQALNLMRQSVEARVPVTVDMIAAVKVFMIFELSIGTGFAGWSSHASVYADLFLILGPDSCTGDFERALFHATHVTAWQQALMSDKPSRFDRPEWRKIPPPLGISASYSVAQRLVAGRAQATVRLPRLITLVRRLRNETKNASVLQEAISLASELLDLVWLEPHSLQPKLQVERTSDKADAHYVPFSFSCTEQDFHKLVQQVSHWSSKIILGGLCEMLCRYDVPPDWPSLSDIRQIRRACADSICMSIEMAARLTPYGPIRIFAPLYIAWGAYWRQQQIAASEEIRAKREWLRRKGNGLLTDITPRMKGLQDPALMFMNDRILGGSISPAAYLAQARIADDTSDAASNDAEHEPSDALSSRTSSVQAESKREARESALRDVI